LYRFGDGPAGASSGWFTDSNSILIGHTKSPNFSTTNKHLYSHGNHLDPHHDSNGHPISNTNQQPVANVYTNRYPYPDGDGDIHRSACYPNADFYSTTIRNLDASSTFGDTDADRKSAAIGYTWGWGWWLIAIPVLTIADHYIFINRQEIRI
jgi:hypothetical protein